MSINQRIKTVRKTSGLNQHDFSIRLGITQSGVSWIEQEGNNVSPQNLKLICSSFGISPRWLETGTGDMYSSDVPADIFDSMRDELKLSDVEENILRKYFELSKESRQAVTDFIVSIGNDVQPPAAGPTLSQSDRDRAHAQLDQELDAAEQDASASHSTARKKA